MVNGVGSGLSHSFRRYKAGRVLKGFQLALNFGHERVKLGEAVDWYKISHIFNILLCRGLL